MCENLISHIYRCPPPPMRRAIRTLILFLVASWRMANPAGQNTQPREPPPSLRISRGCRRYLLDRAAGRIVTLVRFRRTTKGLLLEAETAGAVAGAVDSPLMQTPAGIFPPHLSAGLNSLLLKSQTHAWPASTNILLKSFGVPSCFCRVHDGHPAPIGFFPHLVVRYSVL